MATNTEDSIDTASLQSLLARGSDDPTETQLRLDRFMYKALSSPVQTPGDDITTTELAFCLEVLGIDVTDIKKKVLKSTPLLTLSWVFDALYSDQPDIGNGRPTIQLLRTYSDVATRKVLGTWLFLEHILFAAEQTTLDTKGYRMMMWTRFIDKVSKGDEENTELFLFPEGHVSMGIQQSIVQKRCGVDMKFSENRLGNMISDSSNVPNKQVFNLSKKSLCNVVDDLNTLSSTVTRKAIAKCVNTMNDHPPSTLDLSDPEYTDLRRRTTDFLRTVDEWEQAIDNPVNGGKSLCGESQECKTRIQRLHALAGQARLQSSTCREKITDFRQRSVERDPQNKPTIGERIRSWF